MGNRRPASGQSKVILEKAFKIQLLSIKAEGVLDHSHQRAHHHSEDLEFMELHDDVKTKTEVFTEVS